MVNEQRRLYDHFQIVSIEKNKCCKCKSLAIPPPRASGFMWQCCKCGMFMFPKDRFADFVVSKIMLNATPSNEIIPYTTELQLSEKKIISVQVTLMSGSKKWIRVE